MKLEQATSSVMRSTVSAAQTSPRAPTPRSGSEVPATAFQHYLKKEPTAPTLPSTAAAPVPAQTTVSPPEPAPVTLPPMLDDLSRRRSEIEAMLSQSLKGRQPTAQELLTWQARIFAYSERLEIVSRVVDRSVGAAKTLLTSHS